MIPLIGVPVINRGDLLLDLISSIDYPVAKLAIVQNSHQSDVVDAIKKIKEGLNPNIKSVYISSPFRNLGVSASWNHIITSFPEVPYVVIPSADIKFGAGDLEKVVEVNSHAPDAFLSMEGFACFVITQSVVEKVGLFDENIYPCYYEDNDYHRRIKLANAQFLTMTNLGVIHQGGSQTIMSDPDYNTANGRSFSMNADYYFDKWGRTSPVHDYDSMYHHPFNDTTRQAYDWRYSPYRKRILNSIWGDMEKTSNKTEFYNQ
jgi:GT2 family glycosyltransferase